RLWEFKDATKQFSANKLTFCNYVTEFKLQYLKYVEDELIRNIFLSGLTMKLRDSVAKELKGIEYPTAKQIITAGEFGAIIPFFSVKTSNKFNYMTTNIKHPEYSQTTTTHNTRRMDDLCIYCKRKGHRCNECNIMKYHVK
ncbi:hypothetical protein HMI55_001703, partial [Coelomomyces lativittatus]